MRSHKKKCELAIKVIRDSIGMEGEWGKKHRAWLWPELQKLFQECVGPVVVGSVEFENPGRAEQSVTEAHGETVTLEAVVALDGGNNGSTGQETAFVDGWPVVGEIDIVGLSPNRRMLKGRIGERVVSVERKPGVEAGMRVKGKLMMAGISPLYRVI